MTKPIAIFAGYFVRYPLGGNTLSQIHYLVGLQQLGYDVVFVENHGWPFSCYDPIADTTTNDPTAGIAELRRLFNRFGLDRWCYVDAQGTYHGLDRDQLRQLCRQSTLLMNVASVTWLDEFQDCRQRIYIDVDPAITQFKMPATPTPSQLGYASPYDFHHHFTCGERVGQSDCRIPLRGLDWKPTRVPIALDLVPVTFTPEAKFFTTVMSWTAYGSTEYDGETWGQKDIELMKFVELPARVGPIFEIALAGKNAPPDELRAKGWKISSALEATRSVDSYLQFIGKSRGEFTVAKNAYVKARVGVLYDRTANYLAAGKPVILQDTGISEILPTGHGFFTFRNADDVVAAVEAINTDYAGQCRAAREFAVEHLDARKVFGKLLGECGLPARSA